MKHSLKEIVNETMAELSHVCEGKAVYIIEVQNKSNNPDIDLYVTKYQLELDTTDDEWKSTFLYPQMKAITLMRWIRKGIEKNDGSFIKIN